MRTLIIDNYDSYTYNLYQAIAEVNGELPIVIRNDELEWEELQKIEFDNVVISPGPGRPEKQSDFGICTQVIQHIKVPLLGVCLGHQGIGLVYGAEIIHAPEVRHGRSSNIYHNNSELFRGIPEPFSAVRYHSLLVADELPDCLEKIAWTQDNLVMGLRHRSLPQWGVQFHPESICTEYGKTILENFNSITLDFYRKQTQNKSKINRIIINKNISQKNRSDFKIYSRKLDFYTDSEQAFVRLFENSPYAFWLDSSCIYSGLSRFSFMGDNEGKNSLVLGYCTKNQTLTVKDADATTYRQESIFDYLKREISHRHCSSENLPFGFNGGFVGYFGYELKAECGGELVHVSDLPDGMFIFADRLIVFDHQEQVIYLLYLGQPEDAESASHWFELTQKKLANLSPLPPLSSENQEKLIAFHLSRPYQHYIEDIHQCLQEIHDGETYQVCLTNKIYTQETPDPLTFYRHLRRLNPAPYSAFLRFGETAIACSSPEKFLTIDSTGQIETKPIKGTLKRGSTPEEDLMLIEQLQNSEKDRAENLMIVDLLRNDLGRVCEVGTVHVPKLMAVETYATVHQLVSTIRGHVRADLSAIDCIYQIFPGGSMTGAPKMRTLQIIDRLEQEARGIYSGAIGFLGLNGSADLNIVIRTAVFTPQQTSIGIGGGIVALSNPEMEFEETLLKAQALIKALALALP